MAISEKTIKVLWSRARNRCAFPGCPVAATNELADAETGETFYTPALEQAHIRSKSPSGPRHDPSYTKDLDAYENLILLCGAHHTPVVDAEQGRAVTIEQLEGMKKEHEASHDRLEELEGTIERYLGQQYSADDKILFEQAELRGPTVESMFVDVLFTCRNDVPVAAALRDVTAKYPGDPDADALAPGRPVTGAAQALLSASWDSNALLVGGPGQGKSTLLQFVCQSHRSRLLNRAGYEGTLQNLDASEVTTRLPIRIDLRSYASWARSRSALGNPRSRHGDTSRPVQSSASVSAGDHRWPTIEEFIAHDITARAASGMNFTIRDLGTLVSTRPVLVALDGLDEVANLADRETVSEHIVSMHGRLQASSMNLNVLVATRPGGTTPQLWSSRDFPRLDLLPLSHGLRVQYLQRWCEVAGLCESESTQLQRQFLEYESLSHIKDLASYPMQLAILLDLLHRRQIMPQRRTELYDEYFKTFLDREQAQLKEPLLAADRPLVVSVHAFLGWYIHTETEAGRAAGSIKRAELKKQLRVFLADRENGRRLADTLVEAFTSRMLCLVEREHDLYQFDVQTLREYFAAVYLFEEVDRNKRDLCLEAMLQRPYWSNVLRFYAGRYSTGEVRGVADLVRGLEDSTNSSQWPHLRATCAHLLADRVYHSQTSGPVQNIVDYIFGGDGVVFAEDGLLESSNGHLVLTEGAGRAQAATHLKKRLEHAPPGAMRSVIAKSLSRHLVEDDSVASWLFQTITDDVAWLNAAASLRVLGTHLPHQDKRVAEAMAHFDSVSQWSSELVLDGNYERRDNAVVDAFVTDLNAGAVEVLASRHADGRPLRDLVQFAVQAQGRKARGGAASTSRRSRVRSRPGSSRFKMIAAASSALPSLSDASTTTEHAARIDSIAHTWGDGWILHRAAAALPPDVELETCARLSSDEAAVRRLREHLDMRAGRASSKMWETRIEAASTDVERALLTIDLLTHAHQAALSENAEAINRLVSRLSPRHLVAVEQALRTDKRSRWGQLFIGDAVRRNHSRFSPRVLWLARLVASESSLEHIDAALARNVDQALLDIGGTDLRAPVVLLSRLGKFKASTFHGLRPKLPPGGWASDLATMRMSKRDCEAMISAPLDWPVDLVHLAVQKAQTTETSRSKMLQHVALDEEWMPYQG